MAAALSESEIAEQVMSRLLEKSGNPEKNRMILSTRDKKYIALYLSQVDKLSDTKIKSRTGTIIPITRMLSSFQFGSTFIERPINTILSTNLYDINDMLYTKTYHSHELVPQQYIDTLKNNIPVGRILGDMYKFKVRLVFLLDQVVGFLFEDGTSWVSSQQIRIEPF
jgi:hypothetical protein